MTLILGGIKIELTIFS